MEDDIKTDLRKEELEEVYWISLFQKRDCRKEGKYSLDFESHRKRNCPLWAEPRIFAC